MSISDKEFFHLSISISKALNPLENPLKLKHARSAIISTHRTKESKSFWKVVTKQPLMESRFTAWKFCHLVHKVLREGHPSAIKHSQCHKKMIYEMGKLWGHLQDGVGICIEAYTRLIVTKLEFHEKNPQFAGNLVIDFSDLEKLAGDDINFYFQLGVEIFDYLDDIISLQIKVFTSIKTYRMSSMTPQGQCRLAPLITLIQDSNPLYDLSVRLMFKLHANLPNDILAGHRDRFRLIFNQLKTFYEAVRPLQYFADLIQVPHLPENAPNFTSSVDFGSYIPPVVVVPPEPDLVVENLVDVSADQMQDNRQNTPEDVHITLEQQLREKEDFIRKLEFEVEKLRTGLKLAISTKEEELKDLVDQVSNLNSQLANTYEELHQVNIERDNLKLQATCTPTLEEKASAEEERANATEEKFNKLKGMYTQIRDEHINLLRQHADATKKLNVLAKQNSELVSDKELIKIQVDELIKNQREYEDNLKKTSDLERQEKIHREQYMTLVKDHNNLQIQYDNLQANNTAKITELGMETNLLRNEIIQQKSDHNTTLEMIRNDLFSKSEECTQLYQKLEQFQEQKNEQLVAMDHTNIELIQVNEGLKTELKALNMSYEGLKSLNTSLELKNNNMRIEFEHKIGELQAAILKENTINQEERSKIKLQFEQELILRDVSIRDLKHTISKNNEESENIKSMLERLSEEKDSLECDVQDLLHQHSNLDNKYKKSLDEIKELQASLKSSQIHGKSAVRALLEACIKSSEKLAIRANAEKEFSNVAGTPAYFMMLAEELQNTLNELQIVYKNYSSDNTAVEGFSRKIVLAGHLLSIIQIQGMTVCNTSADIETGEEIADEIKNINKDITAMFEALLMLADPACVLPKISNLKEKINSLTQMIHDLSKKSDDKGHLGDLVELELATMDKAIEEAASKIVDLLSTSRAFDSGIKLEVNERILDACTNLMQTIRILVQRSKALQAEIVSLGKGMASEKEFYKRNNQWSEGLISAAKSVATGANLLVEAANKAVTGEAKNHLNIIVAAQEIAACTAQLVVASRVKAPRESRNLSELSTASRNVTQATGLVVATAKDSSQHLEDSQDLNFSKLTVHQAKTFEMEIQVKVLQLEQDLQSERLKLAAFRRNNYRNDINE